MTTICVPDQATVNALNDRATWAPAAVEFIVWAGEDPVPAGLDQVEFLLIAYDAAPMSPERLALLPQLRVIQLLSAGVETWLDRVPAEVTLCNGRGVHGASTAELALAGILSHLRELPRLARAQGEQRWHRIYSDGLRDRRVLVLGAGDIGARVAAVARILDAEVTVVARRPRVGVLGLAQLPELLPTQQVVVIALPDTPATTGLIDAAFLAALPDGALVVNVARGPVLITAALLAELQSRRLYAFLDVTEVEPLPADHPLWHAPNLVLTPHVGGGTTGWERAALDLVGKQLARFVVGQELANVVESGY